MLGASAIIILALNPRIVKEVSGNVFCGKLAVFVK